MQVEELSGADQAKAFSTFVAAGADDKLRHGNQPELTSALIGGVRRKLNDAYAWTRSSSAVDISPIVAVSEALFAVQTIDTEVHVYSLDEIVAEKRRATAAARVATTEPTNDERPVSTVKRTLLEDMPYAGRRTVYHGPPIGDPNHFPDPRGQQLYTIENHPDGSSCPVTAPDIGTPQPFTESS